ncbi:tyrosine-type recombinase/integrase [Gimesia aquarii]|uniref:Site-specific tyrosine recombinase XerC n=1 Tax=Gimesia aquarii TaxID=2527964 RepID=A0A517X073_9PLAN|nr:site-specific integrase [Gimesia aquarii]QDU10907.1 site-specific tyrosine recombinase XerC [Gimesia aquarii]
MASLENRTGYFNVVFRFGGKKYTRSLHTDDEKEANRLLANLEQTVRDVKSGRIFLPADADIPTFLLSDGKLTTPHVSSSDSISEIQLSLHDLFESFFTSLPDNSLELSTISQMKTHQNNLLRVLGSETITDNIDLNMLDSYCQKRRKDKGRRNRKVSASTIKKELVTLRRVWLWGKKRGKLTSELPEIRDVHLPKSTERPVFQTYDEITLQINQDNLTQEQQDDLWECLYLGTDEIDELIQHVRKKSSRTFLYPMVVAAAHTGARRSELMRSQLSDLRGDVLIIREKKRRRGQESTRRVPMSGLLKETLNQWKSEHPGGQQMFVIEDSTGQQRSGSGRSLSRDDAHYHFKGVLKDSKWDVIRGWHCLRHSFISNLASHSVDQRLIDEFVGHTTEEMRRRYLHLFPDVKRAAITNVFG